MTQKKVTTTRGDGTNTTSFKTRLINGRPALGCLANMGSNIAAEILSHAGYDAVMVDLEHGFGDLPDAISALQAITAAGATPLLRVSSNDPVALKRALDAGPAGIMIPMINSAQEAMAAVKACRYPPRGIRGVAHTIARASGYGTAVDDYLENFEKDFLLICQIETLCAVDAADAIASVPGVDMLFIGPMDLSAGAGHFDEPDHKDVDEMINETQKAARGAGKLTGILETAGRSAPALFERGFDFVLDAVDIALLKNAAEGKVAASRKYTG